MESKWGRLGLVLMALVLALMLALGTVAPSVAALVAEPPAGLCPMGGGSSVA